jgi:hypothetical protein
MMIIFNKRRIKKWQQRKNLRQRRRLQRNQRQKKPQKRSSESLKQFLRKSPTAM